VTDLVLGSASPRRSELLAALGLPFLTAPADILESTTDYPHADARRLALEKAGSVAARHPGAFVLGSDTIVYGAGQSFGKPGDEVEARSMLGKLCGDKHQVLTGLALVGEGVELAEVSVNRVWLEGWSETEIATYVASTDHLDKAGAYAIQDTENPIVERFEGCHCSIMGFPLWRAYRALRDVGFNPTEPSDSIDRCLRCPERGS
jgi:septum formation protein